MFLAFTGNSFTVNIFNLGTVEFLIFIKSKFTTHAPNVFHQNQWTVRAVAMLCDRRQT